MLRINISQLSILIIHLLFFIKVMDFHPADVSDINATKLISTFLIFRHGDRTPFDYQLQYSSDPATVAAVAAKYGYGQLTDKGLRRSQWMGRIVRDRYNELLSSRYKSSEIFIRSTDHDRAKITLLAALAGVYPAYNGSWSDDINWVPVPYTSVPIKYDIFMATENCPTFRDKWNEFLDSPNPRMARFNDLLKTISDKIGIDITDTPASIYLSYDAFVSQRNLEVPLDSTISNLMPIIKAASDVTIDIIYGNDSYIALQSGTLMHRFFTSTAAQISGTDSRRVHIYSAHGGNLYSFMAVSRVERQGAPEYSAFFALELRQVLETGEYVVLPVYLPEPGVDLKYLQVEGCGSLLCPYDKFKNITSPYTLDEESWRIQCDDTRENNICFSQK